MGNGIGGIPVQVQQQPGQNMAPPPSGKNLIYSANTGQSDNQLMPRQMAPIPPNVAINRPVGPPQPFTNNVRPPVVVNANNARPNYR